MSSIITLKILSKALYKLTGNLLNINNMNTTALNTEKIEQYAWVDALLENRDSEEKRDYEARSIQEDAANPEWNEDGLNLGKNVNNNHNECIASLGETGDEDEDNALYERKYAIRTDASLHSKKQKTVHLLEYPMEVDDNVDAESKDYMSENDPLEPCQLFSDDKEEEDLCIHKVDRNEEVCEDCVWFLEQDQKRRCPPCKPVVKEPEKLEYELWDVEVILPDEDFSEPRPPLRYQRQNSCWVDKATGNTVYNGNPDGTLFCNDSLERAILLPDDHVPLTDDDLLESALNKPVQVPETYSDVLTRENTCWEINGATVYNGNPNGSRFLDTPIEDLFPGEIVNKKQSIIPEGLDEAEKKERRELFKLHDKAYRSNLYLIYCYTTYSIFADMDPQEVEEAREEIRQYEAKYLNR